MRIRMFWIMSSLAALSVATSPALAQSELVIDDFKEGLYRVDQRAPRASR